MRRNITAVYVNTVAEYLEGVKAYADGFKGITEFKKKGSAWSEEDYKYYDKTGQYLVILLGRTTSPDEIEEIDSCIEWLKSWRFTQNSAHYIEQIIINYYGSLSHIKQI